MDAIKPTRACVSKGQMFSMYIINIVKHSPLPCM